MINIKHCDCFELLANIENQSIDCIIIDPPYGVLGENTIEQGFNQKHRLKLFQELYRVLKQDSFCAFFGQEPTLTDWNIDCRKAGFQWKEHIVWAKRSLSSPFAKLHRVHESFMIYKKGNPQYYITTGRFSDVNLPKSQIEIFDYTTLTKKINDLEIIINDLNKYGKFRHRTSNKSFYENSIIQIENGKCSLKGCFNNVFNGINLSNVWSFLPNNIKNRNKKGFNHSTVKSLLFLERAIELLTKPDNIVLDCFLGSGTTAVACKGLNRQFIGCDLIKEYYELSLSRLDNIQDGFIFQERELKKQQEIQNFEKEYVEGDEQDNLF